MPIRKKQRVDRISLADLDKTTNEDEFNSCKVMVQLTDEQGSPTGAHILIPVCTTPSQLDELLRTLLDEKKKESGSQDDEENESSTYAFFVDGELIKTDVKTRLHSIQKESFIQKQTSEGRRFKQQDVDALPFEHPEEIVIDVIYKLQANFKVRPITRCSTTLDGHSEAVLAVSFSPDGKVLATGGGDKEIRLWDVNTMTPTDVLKGHKNWVQVLSWSPDGETLISGSREGLLLQWTHDAEYMNFKSKALKAHANYVTYVAWEPFHVNPQCERFVSASKDSSCKVWHTKLGLQFSLNGHGSSVTCVKWGGQGLIYSSSQDKSIILWNVSNGTPFNVLKGHGHWVNFLGLNTDGVIRTAWHDENEKTFCTKEDAQVYAKQRYDKVIERCGSELLVSCSDDNSLFLWNPTRTCSPLSRMTGHQGAIYHIAFSPDGTYIASCGADKSVRLWSTIQGKFIATFRGHVAAVYHVSWSIDSRMLCSGSKDTTLKIWSVANKDLIEDLSGHEDEIFGTDWSPDGQRVATGSKDKSVRIWVH